MAGYHNREVAKKNGNAGAFPGKGGKGGGGAATAEPPKPEAKAKPEPKPAAKKASDHHTDSTLLSLWSREMEQKALVKQARERKQEAAKRPGGGVMQRQLELIMAQDRLKETQRDIKQAQSLRESLGLEPFKHPGAAAIRRLK